MPVIFICILMFVLWIRFQLKKSHATGVSSSEAFWQREDEANHTRNKSTDSLEYIRVPLDQLVLEPTEDPYLSGLQTTLTELASQEILNLSDYTNTELKLAFGTGNFTRLAQCDENYIILMQTLGKIADYHMNAGQIDAAVSFYEAAVALQSENSQTYVNLMLLYTAQNNTSKIDVLKNHVKQSDYKNKDAILRKMDQALIENQI